MLVLEGTLRSGMKSLATCFGSSARDTHALWGTSALLLPRKVLGMGEPHEASTGLAGISRVVCSGQSSDWCWSQWRRCQTNGYTLKCQNLRKPLSILCPRFAQNKPEDIWCTGHLLAQRVCCRLLQDLHVCQKAGETWHTSFLPSFSFSLSSSLSLPHSSLPLLVPPSLSSSLSYGSCFSYFFQIAKSVSLWVLGSSIHFSGWWWISYRKSPQPLHSTICPCIRPVSGCFSNP